MWTEILKLNGIIREFHVHILLVYYVYLKMYYIMSFNHGWTLNLVSKDFKSIHYYIFSFFAGATARGGPWPPLRYASRPLDPLLCLSIRLFPSFSGPWTRHPAISFLVFLFVLLHTAFPLLHLTNVIKGLNKPRVSSYLVHTDWLSRVL